jgi:hypothetical protein
MADNALAQQIVKTARSYQHVVEDPLGSNSGPLIDHWQAFVGAHPGDPWCAGFACSVVHEARLLERMGPLEFKRSSGALRLLAINSALVTTDPQPGDLIIWNHGNGKGHVSIKTGDATHIAGNTSPDGKSRQGTGVYEHEYDPQDPKIAGYIRVA